MRTLFCMMVSGLLWTAVLQPVLAEKPPQKPTTKSESQQAQEKEKEEQKSDYVVVVEDSASYVPSLNVVTTKLPVPLRLTPASVSVVTEQLFDRQDARVLGDALYNVSGVAVHTGFGVHDFFTIRGFDSLTSSLVLIDGAPEPEVTFYHLYNIDRVEVLKGPGAFLYGSNPLSGSVNLVRKKPLSENLIEVGGSFGSFETFEGHLDFNRATEDGRAAFRLNLFGQDSAGYRDDKDNHQFGINPSAAFLIGDRSSLVVDFEYVRNEFASDSGLPVVNNSLPDVSRERSLQTPFDFSDQDLYRFRADFSTQLNESVTLRNKFYFTDLEWVSDGTLFFGAFPNQQGSIDIFRTFLQLDNSQKVVGNQFEALFAFQTGSVRHNLLTGFEINRHTDDFTLDVGLIPPIDLFNPVETATRPIFNVPSLAEAGDARNFVLAPYVVDQITFGEQVHFFVGGRGDFLDHDDDVKRVFRDDEEFSPFLGLLYSPRQEFSLYANWGQAFSPPSSREGRDREPEESKQFEIGAKTQLLDGRILANVAFFHIEKENIAIPDDTGITSLAGDQDSKGIEVEISGEIAPDWYAFVNYAFIDAELTEFRELVDLSFGQFPPVLVDRSGNRPAFVPENLFSFWTVKEFRNGLSLGGGGRFVGDQFIAEDNGFVIEDVFLVDAVAGYRYRNWRLSLNIKNLTNRDYETRGFGANSVIPGNPFTVYGGVEFLLR